MLNPTSPIILRVAPDLTSSVPSSSQIPVGTPSVTTCAFKASQKTREEGQRDKKSADRNAHSLTGWEVGGKKPRAPSYRSALKDGMPLHEELGKMVDTRNESSAQGQKQP